MKLSERELQELQVLESDANDVQELLKAKIVFWLLPKIKKEKAELEKLNSNKVIAQSSELYINEELILGKKIDYKRGYINALIEVAKLLGADG